MRISDWSSDVCSSDLGDVVQDQAHVRLRSAEGFDDLRQQVQDRGTAGGHVQLAGVQAAQLLAEYAAQPVDPDRQRVLEGQRGSVRDNRGGTRLIKTNNLRDAAQLIPIINTETN